MTTKNRGQRKATTRQTLLPGGVPKAGAEDISGGKAGGSSQKLPGGKTNRRHQLGIEASNLRNVLSLAKKKKGVKQKGGG